MTDEERDNAVIGALVVEHEANERRIGTVSAVLYRIGEDLRHLEAALQTYRSSITATESEFHLDHSGHRRSVPRSSVSFDDIRDYVDAWHEALATKGRLEECLQQAGLEKLIAK